MSEYLGNAYVPNGREASPNGCGVAGCGKDACGADLCIANVCFVCPIDVFPWNNSQNGGEF